MRLVEDALESGKVEVVSGPSEQNGSSTVEQRKAWKEPSLYSPIFASEVRKGRLPLVQVSRLRSQANPRDYSRLIKLRGTEAGRLLLASRRLSASELWARRKGRAPNSRGSPSMKVSLLEALSTGPKQPMDLRGTLGVSRRTLDGFVRRGLISVSWGPEGVGAFFKITRRGREELKRLRVVSRLDEKLTGKRLIPLKA